MRSAVLIALATFASAGLGAVSRTALAQTAPASAETEARARFGRGLALYEARDYEGALSEFQAAYDLTHRVSVLYNLGVAHQALHHYPEAARSIEQFLREAHGLSVERRAEVERGLAQIRQFVAHVTIEGAPPGAQLRLDGRAVGTAPLAAPLAVGTGSHTIEVAAEGFHDARENFRIAGAQQRAIAVTMRRVAPSVGAAVVLRAQPLGARAEIDGASSVLGRAITVAPGAHDLRASAPGYEPWSGRITVDAGAVRVVHVRLVEAGRWGPVPFAIVAGATVALAGVATATGLAVLAKHDALFDGSHTADEPAAMRLASDGVTLRAATNVLWAAAGVTGVLTVLALTRTRFGAARPVVDVALAPRLDAPGGEIGLRARF